MKVTLRFDPRDMAEIRVFTMSGSCAERSARDWQARPFLFATFSVPGISGGARGMMLITLHLANRRRGLSLEHLFATAAWL